MQSLFTWPHPEMSASGSVRIGQQESIRLQVIDLSKNITESNLLM